MKYIHSKPLLRINFICNILAALKSCSLATLVQVFYWFTRITARYKANATICQERGRSVPKSSSWLSRARLEWRESGCRQGRSKPHRRGATSCREPPDQTWSCLPWAERGQRIRPEPRGRATPAPHWSSWNCSNIFNCCLGPCDFGSKSFGINFDMNKI